MKFICTLWSSRERPRRDEARARLALYGRLAFWRTGTRSGFRG